MFNFDDVKSRKNTNSVMWDDIEKKCGKSGDDILPAWIADMDYPSHDVIVKGLVDRVSTGYLGYAGYHDNYKKAYIEWFERRHGIKIPNEELSLIPGIKVGMNSALESLAKVGEGVIIQTPVYDPFAKLVANRGLQVVKNSLVFDGREYKMDFDNLESLASDENNKFIIICNPHNPVGRVWSREELRRVGEVCVKNNVTIISDEMYSDLTSKKYTSMLSLSKEISDITICLTSPSKTFNIMSFNIGNLICNDSIKREKILASVAATGHSHLNLGALVAGEIAYKNSEVWVDSVIKYIKKNHETFTEIIENNIKGSKVVELEGGFLAWVDLRSLGYSGKGLEDRLLDKGKLLVGQGYVYGDEGKGFIRVNIAGTREKVKEIANRIIEATN